MSNFSFFFYNWVDSTINEEAMLINHKRGPQFFGGDKGLGRKMLAKYRARFPSHLIVQRGVFITGKEDELLMKLNTKEVLRT